MKNKNSDQKTPFYIVNLGTLENPVLRYRYKNNKK